MSTVELGVCVAVVIAGFALIVALYALRIASQTRAKDLDNPLPAVNPREEE